MIDQVVVINDFCREGGGAAAIAINSALWLRDRGYSVSFISGESAENGRLRERGVEQFATGGKPLLEMQGATAFLTGLFNVKAKQSVRAWIEQHDSPRTVYHLHNWSQILSPSIFSALRPVASRVVLSAHDYFLVCPNGAYANYPHASVCNLVPLSPSCWATQCDRRSYKHKLWRAGRQIVVNSLRDFGGRPPLVIALHEAMLPFLRRGGVSADKAVVIRNPVKAYTESRVPVELNRSFVFVGRLHEGKGPDLAAAAAQKAGVRLTMVGDGPMRDAIERTYPNVDITGWRPESELRDHVSKARAIIIPSRYPEPFGLVAIEALLSGIPVIISSNALLAPEIEQAGVGFSCNPVDVDSLARCMMNLLTDDDLVRSMSERSMRAGRLMATTPDVWITKVIEVYESLLSEARH
jgi:glycosyltransferase involved in cell wall biosynthesis